VLGLGKEAGVMSFPISRLYIRVLVAILFQASSHRFCPEIHYVAIDPSFLTYGPLPNKILVQLSSCPLF
jgi:hypothetical protein